MLITVLIALEGRGLAAALGCGGAVQSVDSAPHSRAAAKWVLNCAAGVQLHSEAHGFLCGQDC